MGTATLLETATSQIPSTVENIGTVTGVAPTSTFCARTTHRLENQRFLISSSWDATSRNTLIVVIGQFAECVTRIVTLKQQFRIAQTSPLLIARIWLTAITLTSITAGSTGTALGAWVSMFCVRARNRMEDWKISSTMKRESCATGTIGWTVVIGWCATNVTRTARETTVDTIVTPTVDQTTIILQIYAMVGSQATTLTCSTVQSTGTAMPAEVSTSSAQTAWSLRPPRCNATSQTVSTAMPADLLAVATDLLVTAVIRTANKLIGNKEASKESLVCYMNSILTNVELHADLLAVAIGPLVTAVMRTATK